LFFKTRSRSSELCFIVACFYRTYLQVSKHKENKHCGIEVEDFVTTILLEGLVKILSPERYFGIRTEKYEKLLIVVSCN
jgi:hypothetical protein